MTLNLPPLALHSLLSIVITSYTIERKSDILCLINALCKQTYDRIELILVIEHSRELRDAVSLYFENVPLNHKILFSDEKLGISAARNIGIKNANGDFIAFTDDDAIPFSDWANEIVQTFIKYKDIIGLTGPVLPLWEHESLNWLPEEMYWMIGCSAWKNFNQTRISDYAWGANMAFRREAFNETLFKNAYSKGAHSEGKMGPVGDDIDFSYNLKKRSKREILYNPRVKVLHKVSKFKLTSKFIRRYSFWQGYSDSRFKAEQGIRGERSQTEIGLLRRVLLNLLPSALHGTLKNNQKSIKQLKVTVRVLFFFGLGYISYQSPAIESIVKNSFRI